MTLVLLGIVGVILAWAVDDIRIAVTIVASGLVIAGAWIHEKDSKGKPI